MITEEMLHAAAARSSEIYVAHLEKGYDPQNQHEFFPEFEKRIQDLKDGKMPGLLNGFRRLTKDCCVACSYQNGSNGRLLPF